jgi:large subunit ribosomal protein L5
MAEETTKTEKAEKREKAQKPEKAQAPQKVQAQARSKRPPKAAAAEQAAQKPAEPRPPEPKLPPRLHVRFESEIVSRLMRELKIENRYRVPRLQKIIINMALNEARDNVKVLDGAIEELKQMTGQKPVITRARKAISNFKLRKGMPIGVMVTLRRERMWEFFDRLANVALPRVRDFRGVSDKAFDGRGNYSLGLREHTIFPELNLDKVEKIKGLTISIVTTARSDFEGQMLLQSLGLPLRGGLERERVAVAPRTAAETAKQVEQAN